MSEHHEEIWAEFERLSRRIALQEQRLMERILVLEAEVAALRGEEPTGNAERGAYQDARSVEWHKWRRGGAGQAAIDEIMQR